LVVRKTLIQRLLEEREANLWTGQIQDDTQPPKKVEQGIQR
jgi:hypothetical protein